MRYQIIGGMKFFERAEVKDLLGYLRLSVNPSSDADLARKFHSLVDPVLGAARADEIIALATTIAQAGDVRALVAAARPS